jgi:MoxR-like ATPase
MSDARWTQLPRKAQEIAAQPLNLPLPISEILRSPEAYVPDDGLVTAANVALLLGQPLLITGEPGCGKTAFGYWLASQLGLGQPLVDVVKSTSSGRDLLYEFDSLARFRDSRPVSAGNPDAPAVDDERYVRFRPLGAAIASSADPDVLGGRLGQRVDETLQTTDGDGSGNRLAGQRRVVLIDELDKAPRDTPNDLLHEIEKMEFTVVEIDKRITGKASFRPIVVITSNSERSLPDPFLRRCVYYNIPNLDSDKGRERLTNILNARADGIARAGDEMLAESFRRHGSTSVEGFYKLRKEFQRKPGTAEFLALALALARQELAALQRGATVDTAAIWRAAMVAIAKSQEDRDEALAQAAARP